MRIWPVHRVLLSSLALVPFVLLTAPLAAQGGPPSDSRKAPVRVGRQSEGAQSRLMAGRTGRGQAGKLDRTFGTAGLVEEDWQSVYSRFAQAVVAQPDGWILLGGGDVDGARIIRYDPDGERDPAFGDNGTVSFGPEGPGIEATVLAMALQPDGKIIAACERLGPDRWDWYRFVARLNPDGSLDTGFGTSGYMPVGIPGPNEDIADLALQSDGKIVVGGRRAVVGWDFYLVRLRDNGGFDYGFGIGGEVITNFPRGNRDWIVSLLVQPDGKIVAVGDTVGDIGIVRYESNGLRDFGFADDGFLVSDIIVGPDWGALQPDGSIVVIGLWRDIPSPYSDMAATRFFPDGTLDTAFGEDGRARIDFNGLLDSATAGAIQDDGAIVIGGNAHYFHAAKDVSAIGLTRLNPDGTLDRRFGRGGTSILTLGASPQVTEIALQPDGGILMGGWSFGGASDPWNTWYLARFHP